MTTDDSYKNRTITDVHPQQFPRRFAVLGNNVCAWLAATMLARNLDGLDAQVTVFSEDTDDRLPFRAIRTSATLATLIASLGADEQDMLRSCRGTYHLGARFSNWPVAGHSFVQPVCDARQQPELLPLYDKWQIGRDHQDAVCELHQLVIQACAARHGRSPHSFSGNSPLSGPSQYGYHVDVTGLAEWFRTLAVGEGVAEMTDEVCELTVDSQGHVTHVQLERAHRIAVDFVLDCRQSTEHRRQQTSASWEDLSANFRCDRVVRQTFEGSRQVPSMTRIQAQKNGWTACVPLHQEIEMQYVFSRSQQSDGDALRQLNDQASVDLRVAQQADSQVGLTCLSDPVFSCMNHARCSEFWQRNVLRIGPAALEMEPLAAKWLHLVVVQLERFLDLLNLASCGRSHVTEYNRQLKLVVDETFDYVALHHWLRRPASLGCGSDSLKRIIALYDANGSIATGNTGAISKTEWGLLLTGAGRRPVCSSWDLRQTDSVRIERELQAVRVFNEAVVRDLPAHEALLDWIHSAPFTLEAG